MPMEADDTVATVTHIGGKGHHYNIPELQKFLDTVYHDITEDDGYVLTWAVKPGRSPGFPISETELIDRLTRSTAPLAIYSGTATCHKTDDGRLVNRKSQFAALTHSVLDDIDGKIPLDTIPVELRDYPTYILETSPGNFQYGYVYARAIRNLITSKALTTLIYSSGYTDSGGAQPTKLVRLPAGVNGKAGERGAFKVRLVALNPENIWTPERMLTAIKSDVTWADLEADADKAMRSRRLLTASRWSDSAPSTYLKDGVVDPVLEWLYDTGRVMTETDEWITIKCPWGDKHTSGDDTAGYSPVGCGDAAYETRRGFNCFHDHCSEQGTVGFLKWVAESGGPEVGVADHAAKLLTEWIYDAVGDQAISLKTGHSISMAAFKNLYPHKVAVYTAEDKVARIPITDLWKVSPLRVTVRGSTSDVTTDLRIVEHKDGSLRRNLYEPPDWGPGPIDFDHVARFQDFLEYLIPKPEEREFFLCWVVNKAHDMAFRGPAILMVTEQQGTGRTTLADMIRTLFGMQNMVTMPFDKLTASGDFNEYLEYPIVQTDETMQISNHTTLHKAYEALKDLVDFRPKPIRVNPKYERIRQSLCCSSFLMFTNHEAALGLSYHDRRMYVLSNTTDPASPEYFASLNHWLTTTDWAASVWRWLLTLPTDTVDLTAPAPSTEAKDAMLRRSSGPVGICIDIVLELWPLPWVWHGAVKELVQSQDVVLHTDPKTLGYIVLSRIRERSRSMHGGVRVTAPKSGQVRPRLLTSRLTEDLRKRYLGTVVATADRAAITEAFAAVDLGALQTELGKRMRAEDF